MTPLQALENLKTIDIFIDGAIWQYTDTDYEDDIKTLEKVLTPPTADEVCEALSKLPIYKDDKITYDEKTKRFMYNDFAINDEEDIQLFILLGRFYEAQE